MKKIDNEIDLLIENTWRLEYDEWVEELRKRRLEFVKNFDGTLPFDEFHDITTRCWGDINGRLSEQYFELLNELKYVNAELYEKYKADAVAILKMFDFYLVTRKHHIEFRETGTLKLDD